MNKVGLFLSSMFQMFLKYLRDTGAAKTVATYVAKTVLKISGGPKAWLVMFVVKKLVYWGLMKAEDAADYVDNTIAHKEIMKEIAKPKDQVDWGKIDELEKEIFEGK